MSALSLRLPNSIHQHIREIAKNEGVSINQFVSSAVSEKISAIMTEDYLKSRAKRAKKSDLKKILDNVPKRKPILGDEL
jgi:uncharacterized protein (DUF1778 family)